MNFEDILFKAKQRDMKAIEQLLEMFRPMLIRNSLVNGRFDEDMYQELVLETLRCIKSFRMIIPFD